MLINVVLPAPFSPTSAWISPEAAEKSTWSFAVTRGKRFVMLRISIAEGWFAVMRTLSSGDGAPAVTAPEPRWSRLPNGGSGLAGYRDSRVAHHFLPLLEIEVVGHHDRTGEQLVTELFGVVEDRR